MAGRLAMHLQGKMAPNQVHVRVAVYPALKPRGVELAEGAFQVGVFIDRPDLLPNFSTTLNLVESVFQAG